VRTPCPEEELLGEDGASLTVDTVSSDVPVFSSVTVGVAVSPGDISVRSNSSAGDASGSTSAPAMRSAKRRVREESLSLAPESTPCPPRASTSPIHKAYAWRGLHGGIGRVLGAVMAPRELSPSNGDTASCRQK
jgi:hypothetical protein